MQTVATDVLVAWCRSVKRLRPAISAKTAKRIDVLFRCRLLELKDAY